MIYRITMSVGEPILCMPQELARLLLALRHGQPCVLRQGIINPEHFIAITEEKKTKVVSKASETLPDIFHGVELRAERGGQKSEQSEKSECVENREEPRLPAPPKKAKQYDPWKRVEQTPPVDNLLGK